MKEINISEYNGIIKMLKASTEDFEIGFFSLINSNYSNPYTLACVIAHQLVFEKRKRFIDRVNENKVAFQNKKIVNPANLLIDNMKVLPGFNKVYYEILKIEND